MSDLSGDSIAALGAGVKYHEVASSEDGEALEATIEATRQTAIVRLPEEENEWMRLPVEYLAYIDGRLLGAEATRELAERRIRAARARQDEEEAQR